MTKGEQYYLKPGQKVRALVDSNSLMAGEIYTIGLKKYYSRPGTLIFLQETGMWHSSTAFSPHTEIEADKPKLSTGGIQLILD